MKLNINKIWYKRKSVTYMRHILSHEGLMVDEKKVGTCNQRYGPSKRYNSTEKIHGNDESYSKILA